MLHFERLDPFCLALVVLFVFCSDILVRVMLAMARRRMRARDGDDTFELEFWV